VCAQTSACASYGASGIHAICHAAIFNADAMMPFTDTIMFATNRLLMMFAIFFIFVYDAMRAMITAMPNLMLTILMRRAFTDMQECA